MTSPIKILIVGNGFGGTYTLKNLRKLFRNNRSVELSLVGEKNYFLFTPLLHEVATGGINPENIVEPIRKVLGYCLKNFYLGKAEVINLNERTVRVEAALLRYDYLVLAPGAETNFYNIMGAQSHSFTLKSLDDAIKIKNHCILQMEKASHAINIEEREKILRFIVVGGGPTGVEMAAELQEFIQETFVHYFSKDIINDSSVVLIERGEELLSSFGVKMRKKSLEFLRKKKILVMLNTQVREVRKEEIILDDNASIKAETIIWVAGVKPVELCFDVSILKSPGGRLIVNKYLQLENYKEVFVIGDAASFTQKNVPLPALAQVAQREAGVAAKNIELLIKKEVLKEFSYHHTGSLISLGRWMAIGEILNFTFWGGVAWWIWRTVYLSKLLSTRKKLRVAIDWTMNIFSGRDISQI